MIKVFERYNDIETDGVIIDSWRGLKGDKKNGILEVISITGHRGNCIKGMLYNPEKYTYEQAMQHWKNNELPKFTEVACGQ